MRLGLILAVVLGLLAAPDASHAQQAKVWRLGVILVAWSPSGDPPKAFQQGLRDLGYVEGQNLIIDWRSAEGAYDRVPRLVTELVRLKPDVLVVDSTLAARSAKQATATIPIVMAVVADPVGSGLVASLARPGGNVTGNSFMMTEIVAKRLQLLKEAVPRASRVAVLWNPTTPWHQAALKEIGVAAPALRMRFQPVAVRGPNEFERAFSSITKGGADALFVIEDAMFGANKSRLLERIARSRLPAISGQRDFADDGCLITFGANFSEMFRRSATFVDRILKGAKPADLPVEQPTKFELVVNLKTARALGLTIPQSVLLRADAVIQ